MAGRSGNRGGEARRMDRWQILGSPTFHNGITKMKTLDEFNEDARKAHEALDRLDKPSPNGIACHSCGTELLDSFPMLTLTSNPPQKNVHCPACGYRGFRVT